jgi:hypothetical protein
MIFNYKYGLVWFILMISCLVSQEQEIIRSENFETYTAGARLCTVAPAYWFTWNNGPGTSEDPIVADTLAFQGSKSLEVTGANDVLLDLNGKTTGRYEVSFYGRIPAGKSGFFGLLHNFSGNTSEWGMQCFLDTGKKGTIQAGGTSADFIYNNDQWILFSDVVDLDNNHAEMYVNQTLVHEWQWSKRLDGNPGTLKLDALNFFAWNADQRQPFMFIDSILFEKLDEPDPPLNLRASVTGNTVSLQWEAPVSGTPNGYKVYRDSSVIASLVTGLTYDNAAVYPGTYSYFVKAVYGSGMSSPAGPAQATVAGGIPRKTVLLEIATGTWCTYCPGAAMGADDLVSNGKTVAIIEYHNADAFSNADADARNSYYNVPGYPTAHFDGISDFIGGNMTQSIYPDYLPIYDKCISKLSLFEMAIEVVKSGSRDLQVTLTTRKIYPYANNFLRLHLVLTETNIPKTWQTFMKEVNFVCRKMYPGPQGTPADFSSDSVVTLHYTISVDSSYIFHNCSLVAFLQDNTTKEILQSDLADLGTLGLEDPAEINVAVYPNPATDRVFIKSDELITSVELVDVSGRSVYKIEPSQKEFTISVSSLMPATYILYLKTAKGVIARKLIILP